MNHHDHVQNGHVQKRDILIKDFVPLIIIVLAIVLFTIIMQVLRGFSMHAAMYDFMGSFFVVFGAFKIINLRGFAQAYAVYDVIAQRSAIYAYTYPFIELMLGILYFTRKQLFMANMIVIVLMVVGSAGVLRELLRGREIVCACLGVVFKIPMTYVTLAEDMIMGAMAFVMLCS